MEGNNTNGNNMPTEKQLAVIRRLAKKAGNSIDLSKVTSKKEASKLIEELIAKQNGNGSNGNHNDCRERKVAYGLATKLIFCQFKEQKKDWDSEIFWNEVDSFFNQYMERQDRAVKLGSPR